MRRNARNNYQIMHVELVFPNPRPLKGKGENTAMRVYKTEKNPTALVTQEWGLGGCCPGLRVSLGF